MSNVWVYFVLAVAPFWNAVSVGATAADINGTRIWSPYFAKCLGLGRTKQHSADGSTQDFIKKGPGARLELEDCAFDDTAANQWFTLTSQSKTLKTEDTGELIRAHGYALSTRDHVCVGYDDDATGGESLLYSYEPQHCAASNSTFLFFTSGHRTQGVQLAQAQLHPRCLAALPDAALGNKVALRDCVVDDNGQYWQFCDYQLDHCTGNLQHTDSRR